LAYVQTAAGDCTQSCQLLQASFVAHNNHLAMCSVLQAAEELAATQAKWHQQLTALQQAKAAGEAGLAAAHEASLAAREQALKTEAERRLTAAEAEHKQAVHQLQQQLAAARALVGTTEDSAAQQTAVMLQQLEQEQKATQDLRYQLQQLQDQLEQAAVMRQQLDTAQVSTSLCARKQVVGKGERRRWSATTSTCNLVTHLPPPSMVTLRQPTQHPPTLCLPFPCTGQAAAAAGQC
jgi:hypothetical protein